jgi:DNA-binding transcriptional regulator YiaG
VVSNPRLRTLRRALELIGTEDELAEALGVGFEELADWLAGRTMPPDTVYFAVLDLVAKGPYRGA